MPTARLDAEVVDAIESTTARYLALENSAVLRERRSLKRIQDANRVMLNVSGVEFTWPVLRDEIEAITYITGDVRYTDHQVLTSASLARKGYINPIAMHKYDQLMNRGKEALVNLWTTKVNLATLGMKNKLFEALYLDGTNTDGWDGFETWCGANTSYDSTGADVADLVAQPNDSYATLSTLPGTVGGTWSANLTTKPNANIAYDWPEGTGDALFDYWTPILANWSSTSWPSGSSNGFASTCEYVLSQMLQWLTVTRGFAGPPDSVVCDGPMYQKLKSALRADRQYHVEVSDKADFGLGPTLNYEGMTIWTEYGVPANSLYMYRTQDLDILCLEGQLITKEGPFFDENNFMTKMAVTSPSNLRIRTPRNFGKAKNYAAS